MRILLNVSSVKWKIRYRAFQDTATVYLPIFFANKVSKLYYTLRATMLVLKKIRASRILNIQLSF